MNPLDWSGPQGPLDVLLRFAGGALVLIVLSTVVFGALGGDEPADAVAAPTPSPSVVFTEPTGTQQPSSPTTSEPPASTPATEPTTTDQPTTTEEPNEPTDPLDPAAISIQVLDGVLTDGGESMRQVAQALRDQGYNVIAENRARQPYEQTTVFYTAGYQAQAEQVAAAIGASAVEQQPGNLSQQVQVHIVVADD
jgi:hypothetical protein